MNFILKSISYSEKDLLTEYPKLAEFEFFDCVVRNETRKAIVLRDLDELMKLREAVDKDIIIHTFSWEPGELTYYLEIYDGWIE